MQLVFTKQMFRTLKSKIIFQLTCIAFRGDGNPRAVAILSMVSAAKEVLSWKARKFRILKNIPFPSEIAVDIVKKLSSAKTISAASLATSVPTFPEWSLV